MQEGVADSLGEGGDESREAEGEEEEGGELAEVEAEGQVKDGDEAPGVEDDGEEGRYCGGQCGRKRIFHHEGTKARSECRDWGSRGVGEGERGGTAGDSRFLKYCMARHGLKTRVTR